MNSIMSKEQIIQFNEKARAENILPIKVPSHYKKLVQEEHIALGHGNGPLSRVVYPAQDRFELRTADEVIDFEEEKTNMPADMDNILIHKYRKRALFLVTEKCVGHCMYCFRQDTLSDIYGNPLPQFEQRLNSVISYLKNHPEVTELILSGGDPLNISFRHLENLLERLAHETEITDIRIHSRNIVFEPQMVSKKIAKLLGKYKVRIYIHAVHPYEIEQHLEEAILLLHDAGVRTYSQFPILRGINDHVEVLEKLIRKLDDLRCNPVNLHIPDPVNYSAGFRIPLKRIFSILDELFWTAGSWTNCIRVTLDSPIGKLRREDIVNWDEQKGIISFQREGKQVIYHDFPAELDIPGDIDTLLWKG
jgi:lysine 2,3-aminomutase